MQVKNIHQNSQKKHGIRHQGLGFGSPVRCDGGNGRSHPHGTSSFPEIAKVILWEKIRVEKNCDSQMMHFLILRNLGEVEAIYVTAIILMKN